MTAWVVAASLAALLVGLEIRRPDRRRLLLRSGLVLLVVAALVLLLRPPMLPSQPGPHGVAVLLTPGADDAARGFLADSLPGAPTLSSPDSVADLGALQRRLPEAHTAILAGWGLRASQLMRHGTLALRRHPTRQPPGMTRLEWTREVNLGNAASAYLRLEASDGDRLVRFEGPGGERDSVQVPADSAGQVVFRVTPKSAGVARLLVAVEGASADTLPVIVRRGTLPAVLILEGFPSFETTFLRRWLAGQGGSVAVRTTVSRGRDRVDRVNLPTLALRPLSPGLLDRFDLVLIDGPTLAGLGPSERRALASAVESGGLGLLVTPDSLARRDPEFFPFRLSPTGDIDDRLVRPLWPQRADRSTTAVPAAAESIDPSPTLQTLMRDPVGRILAAAIRRGSGRLATSVVVAPSRWMLEQESAAFGGYWSTLLQATAHSRGDRWSVLLDGPAVPGLPVTLVLQSEHPSPVAIVLSPSGHTDTLGLVQDLTDPSRWWARFWPDLPGTYAVAREGEEPHPFVVEPSTGTGREARSRLDATAWWSELSEAGPAPEFRPVRRPLRPLGPFLLLLTSLGLLWGENRGLSPNR